MSEATVTFGAKDKNLKSTITGINREMGGMGKTTKATSKSVNMSFASMAKAGAALALGVGVIKGAFALARKTIASFKEAIDLGGELSDLKEQTGVAAGEMLILRRAFDNSGVGADKAGTAINKMQKAIVDAGAGLSTQVRAFERMGLSIDDIRKLSPDKQFNTIGKALAGMKDPTDKAATSMDIFGRSGGRMLSLFNNFDGEMKTASAQLGLMPAIMSKMSDQFDKISDKLGVIRGKFVEFAAGALSRVAPLLDLVTEALANFDAAAAGVKLADIFVGAGVAMQGFQTALDGFKAGKFKLSMKVVAASIKLQFAESANSIFANLKGAFEAALHVAVRLFGPGSAVWITITRGVEVVGLKLSKALGEGMAVTFKAIGNALPTGMGYMFNKVAKSLDEETGKIEHKVKQHTNVIKNVIEDLPSEILNVGREAAVAFSEGFKNAGELFDTSKVKAELEDLAAQIKAGMEKTGAELPSLDDMLGGALGIEISQELVTMADQLLEIEKDILRAKGQGNDEMVKQLEASLKSKKAFQKALDMGLTLQEATALAGKTYEDSIKGAAEGMKKNAQEAKEVVKELGLAAKLGQRIQDFQNEGRAMRGLKAKAEKAMNEGNIPAANRARRMLKKREDDAALRGEGKNRDRRHLRDIAKDEGVDMFRKNNDEIRKAIMEKRKEKAEKEAKEKKNKDQEKDGKGKAAEKPKENKLENLVGDVFKELQSIGKKLPTHALGV